MGANLTNSWGIVEFTPRDWYDFHNGLHDYRVVFLGTAEYAGCEASAVITIENNAWQSRPVLTLSLDDLVIREKQLGFYFEAHSFLIGTSRRRCVNRASARRRL